MKKTIFSLLILCFMATAWAGTGDGTKDRPYSGLWYASDLAPKLKAGDYLAYDCVIKNGMITVSDNTLMVKIVSSWSKWAVSDPIDKTPYRDYRVGCDYCTINSFEDRQTHMFQIMEVDNQAQSDEQIIIKGSYSGKYFSDEEKPQTNDVSIYIDSIGKICVHNSQELMAAVREYYYTDKTIQIMNDIDMSDYSTPGFINTDGKIYGADFRARLCGYYFKRDEKGEFLKDEKGERKYYSFELSHLNEPLFDVCHNATIRGIKLVNTDLSSPVRSSQYLICKEAYGTEFTDVTIQGCRYNDEAFLKSIPLGVGFLYDLLTGSYSGHLSRKMYDCKVKRVDVIGSTIFLRGLGVGGIVGYAKGTTFDDCRAEAGSTVFVSTDGDAYAGGLVGEAVECDFKGCINLSAVYGSEKADNVGGVCGYSTSCNFEKCYNGGVLGQITKETWTVTTLANAYDIVSSLQTLYGIGASIQELRDAIMYTEIAFNHYINTTSAELLSQTLSLYELAKTAEMSLVLWDFLTAVFIVQSAYSIASWTILFTNSPDEMGGISSAAYGCTFDRCMNGGRLFCRDAYCGGIVGRAGYADGKGTEIRNSINVGFLQGDEQTGGIVGCLENGHIYNCLNTGTIDCATKATAGAIYGDSDVSAPATNCFAMVYGADDHPNGLPDNGQVTEVSYRDVLSGLVACELNRLSGTSDFCQNVGMQAYPTLFGTKPVSASDIRQDVDLIYKVADNMDFTNAIFNQYAEIELVNDIDFRDGYFSAYREATPFRGSIDGKGHCLKKISISTTDVTSDYNHTYAMIGAAEGATFKNFRLDSCQFKYPTEASGLVYISKGCTYENVYLSKGTTVCAKPRVGGLIYRSYKDTLIHCGVGLGSTVTTTPFYDERHLPIRNTPTGGLVWNADGSTFIDCYNQGMVTADFGPVGGLVVESNNCDFIHCTTSGVVRSYDSPDFAGGIAAKATKSKFYRCANYGRILAERKYAGAILGDGNEVTINSCFQSLMSDLEFDDVDAENSGSIIGRARNNTLIVNCAAEGPGSRYPIVGTEDDLNPNSGNNYRAGNSPADTPADAWEMWASDSDFRSGKVCFWLNNGPYNRDQNQMPWRMTGSTMHLNDEGAPVTANDIVNEYRADVTKISRPEDLVAFAEKVNNGDQFACAVLLNDIDMDGIHNFVPIGKNEAYRHFRGMFNGNGHTIRNLKVTSNRAAGLFGAVHTNASISNVIIGEGCEFTCSGDEGVGGIVGEVAIGWQWGNVVIENCGNHAMINALNSVNAGGILGLVRNTTKDNIRVYVSNCYNVGTITTQNGNSALLCGYMRNSGVVSNCWSTGKLLTSTEGVTPYDGTQGRPEFFVGYFDILDIKNCYAIEPATNVQGADTDISQTGVTNYRTNSLTGGELTHALNQSLTEPLWQQNLGTDLCPTFGSKGLYHTRKVSSQYGTACFPFSVKSDPQISYYRFDQAAEGLDIKLMFKYAEEMIPAGTPVLFRAVDASEATAPVEVCFSHYADGFAKYPNAPLYPIWDMEGTFEQKVFTETTSPSSKEIYYVSNGTIKNAKQTTIAPYRAYFYGPSIDELFGNDSSGARSVSLVIEDEDGSTSALEFVGCDLVPAQSGKTYNLMGTEVGEGYHGIVIKDGKKMLQAL